MSELSLAERVVKAFGGLTKMSAATGFPITTIDSWQSAERGIPHWRLGPIRSAAKAAGVELPGDFPKEEAAA